MPGSWALRCDQSGRPCKSETPATTTRPETIALARILLESPDQEYFAIRVVAPFCVAASRGVRFSLAKAGRVGLVWEVWEVWGAIDAGTDIKRRQYWHRQ
ncbi:MAG TPA: hypothetical protein VJZ71_21440 [Phycisphaerae bacterium]|nr:hypothetical protein [Phycisphaerae bacterium]